GSNVFNILSVLGAASLVRPIPIPGGFIESGLVIDYAVMMFTSFLPWLMMRKTSTVTRKGGFILLCCYVGYLVYLIMKIQLVLGFSKSNGASRLFKDEDKEGRGNPPSL
ncbi:MAG: hypothetical protein ABIN18_29175, partial [Pseudomonadota bacterium]